jgi:ribosomal protein S18 acetylase RimI-like enzyme
LTEIVQVTTSAEIESARTLFLEYAAWIGIDLGFQGFDEEVASLPGCYVPPRGVLLLAPGRDGALGCVALRPLEWPEVAELKRLYVRPEGRGRGVARALSETVLSFAAEAGYRRVRLDTLPTMTAALSLYESLGFRDIEPYRFNPFPEARYLELVLEAASTDTTIRSARPTEV